MQFGISSNGDKISIISATSEEVYYCPICKVQLVPKRGKINIWHFAHKNKINCIDYYDNKGVWHRKMQNIFPEHNREIYDNKCNRHIYDILTDNNTIIEFQQSSITKLDFEKRTNDYIRRFYNKPIWVFNLEQKEIRVSNKKYDNVARRKFHWSRSSKIFGDINIYKKSLGYELWFMVNPYSINDFSLKDEFGFIKMAKEENSVRKGIAFVKVIISYNNFKTFIGDCKSEADFIKYLQSK